MGAVGRGLLPMALKSDLPISECPVPATYRSPPRKRRVERNRSGDVMTAIGPLEPGCEVFAVTNGQFSMIDVLEYVLAHSGPASIDLATWTAADGDLRRAHAFALDGRVKGFRLVVDPSFKSRKPEFCEVLIELFGHDAVRTVPLHGKFAVVRGARSFAIRSSMNLNPNRRIETVEISEDPALCDFLVNMVDEIFERSSGLNFRSQSKGLMEKSASKSRLVF